MQEGCSGLTPHPPPIISTETQSHAFSEVARFWWSDVSSGYRDCPRASVTTVSDDFGTEAEGMLAKFLHHIIKHHSVQHPPQGWFHALWSDKNKEKWTGNIILRDVERPKSDQTSLLELILAKIFRHEMFAWRSKQESWKYNHRRTRGAFRGRWYQSMISSKRKNLEESQGRWEER